MNFWSSEVSLHVKQVNKHHAEHGIKTEFTSVWLAPNDTKNLQIFYCHQCRYPLIQYQGDVVTMLPGDSPARVPLVLQCKGRMCGQKYIFHTIR